MSVKLTIFFVLSVLATINSLPVEEEGVIVIHNKKEFHYLGHLNLSKDGKVFEKRRYYVSGNAAPWNTAQQDCETIFDNGHLLAIETLEERKGLSKYLGDFGSGEEYWTGGSWSKTHNAWLWPTEKTVDTVLINVIVANPNPNKQDRITFQRNDVFTATFDYRPDTLLLRYICEA